jgi:hypothetical protein
VNSVVGAVAHLQHGRRLGYCTVVEDAGCFAGNAGEFQISDKGISIESNSIKRAICKALRNDDGTHDPGI